MAKVVFEVNSHFHSKSEGVFNCNYWSRDLKLAGEWMMWFNIYNARTAFL